MNHVFYSSVILNSTETKRLPKIWRGMFYSSVILNSTETTSHRERLDRMFYSSVILNSTETQIGDFGKKRPGFTVVLY